MQAVKLAGRQAGSRQINFQKVQTKHFAGNKFAAQAYGKMRKNHSYALLPVPQTT